MPSFDRRLPELNFLAAAMPTDWPQSPPLVIGQAERDALAQIGRLVHEAREDDRHKATSLRLNESLRAAAEVAVGQGWAKSFTSLVEGSLAAALGDFVSIVAEQAALDEHYAAHPDVRPDLWEIAHAAAQLDGSELADHPNLIEMAVDALGDGANVDDVLTWAAGALAGQAPVRSRR